MWIRRTRFTLLIALLLAVAILAWLAGHPQLYAGHLGRLVTKHLLQDLGVTFSCDDMAGNPLGSLRFYDVVLTRDDQAGGFAYLACDSLDLRYQARPLLARRIVVDELVLHSPDLSVRRGSGSPGREDQRPPTPESAGAMPPLHVQRLAIVDGSVDVQGASLEERERVERIGLESTLLMAGDGIDLELHTLRAFWRGGWVEELALDGRFERDGDRWSVHEGRARADSVEARFDAALLWPREGGDGPSLEADVEAVHLDLASMLELFGKPMPLPLVVDGRAKLAYAGARLEVDGAGSGRLGEWPFDLSEFRAHLDEGRFVIDSADGEFNGGLATVSGEIDTGARRMRLDGRTSGFDLSRNWNPDSEDEWPASDVAGAFRLQLGFDDPKPLRVELVDGRGEFLEQPLDSLSLELQVDEVRGLQLERASALVRGSPVSVSGSIDAEGVAELLVQGRDARPDEWLQLYAPEWDVRGAELAGTLSGPIAAPALRLTAFARAFSRDEFRGEQAQLALRVDRLDQLDRARGEAFVGDLFASTNALGSLRVEFERRGDRILLPEASVALRDSVVRARGALTPLTDGAFDVEVDSLEVALGDNRWWLERPARVELGPRRLVTERMRLIGQAWLHRTAGSRRPRYRLRPGGPARERGSGPARVGESRAGRLLGPRWTPSSSCAAMPTIREPDSTSHCGPPAFGGARSTASHSA